MAKEKPKKPKKPAYYTAGKYWGSGLAEGSNLTVDRVLTYHGEKADFTPFLSTPIKELEERLKASVAEEKKFHDQLQEQIKGWDELGARTLLLKKVIEYLKVPTVKHTNNVWTEQKDGSFEISNLVYKMTFSIIKANGEWKLSWALEYQAPGYHHSSKGYTRTPKERIDHEGSKKYKTLDSAQKYIQLKFDQYSRFFSEESPPIPPEAKELFCVNGQLLQGYKVAKPKAIKKEPTVDELLNCLDEEKPSEKPKVEKPPEKPKPQKKAPVKKKHTLAR